MTWAGLGEPFHAIPWLNWLVVAYTGDSDDSDDARSVLVRFRGALIS